MLYKASLDEICPVVLKKLIKGKVNGRRRTDCNGNSSRAFGSGELKIDAL